MTWFNGAEVEQLAERFDAETTPNVFKAARTLERFMDWVDSNSDGWAYWQRPRKAAARLMERLKLADDQYRRGGLCEEMSTAQLSALLRPIRALLREYGVESTDSILFPPPPPPRRTLSLAEAQELHLLVGGPIGTALPKATAVIVQLADLERARELAAIIVSDLEGDDDE